MRKLKLFSLVVIVLSMVVACSSRRTNEQENTQRSAIVATQSDLITMDHHAATDTLSFEVIGTTIEGLYGYNKDGEVIPVLATSYDVSEDGLVYTFHLNEEATWDNGTPVTANDFVYAWRRLAKPEIASENAYLLDIAGIKNAASVLSGELPSEELGVKAIDEKTLEVTLELPVAFLINLLASPVFLPLNEEFVQQQGDNYGKSPDCLLANGPFKMSAWNQGHSFAVKKNDTYYDQESVELAGLDYRLVPDSQTAVLEFESGNLDVIKISGEMIDVYQGREELASLPSSGIFYLSANELVPEVQNVNVRQAIARAINKEELTTIVLNDGSKVADYIIPTDLSDGPDGKDFRETSDNYLTYDVALAQEYWEKATAELGVETLKLELLTTDTDNGKKCAEYIQSQLQTNLAGLVIEIKAQPFKQRIQLCSDGDYQLALVGWGAMYADPTANLNLFLSDASYNDERYSSSDYDELMERINKGDLVGDAKARWEALKEAEKMLLEEDAAIMPLYQQSSSYLINKNLKELSGGTRFIYKDAKFEIE